jgi:hypothetical protein
VAGLAQADGLTQSRFEITINSSKCTAEPDLADLSLFSGVARAVRQRCAPGSVRDGYNEIQIKQLPGEPQQKIVWLEMRIVPR